MTVLEQTGLDGGLSVLESWPVKNGTLMYFIYCTICTSSHLGFDWFSGGSSMLDIIWVVFGRCREDRERIHDITCGKSEDPVLTRAKVPCYLGVHTTYTKKC